MADLDLVAVLAATGAAFALGGLYYALLGGRLAEVSEATGCSSSRWWERSSAPCPDDH